METLFSSRKEEEQKMQKSGRLPPGQSLTQKFPILHYGSIPSFNPAQWTFHVTGEVITPLKISWEQFMQLPRRKLVMDIHCVTRWSKFDTEWEGVSVKDLIDQAIIQLKPGVKFVIEEAEFGYTTNLPLSVVLSENFLLATHYDGVPITPEHGYPLRGVVGAIPGREELFTPYFWKGAKWLRGLNFVKEDIPGFWEEAGYNNHADVWREERYR